MIKKLIFSFIVVIYGYTETYSQERHFNFGQAYTANAEYFTFENNQVGTYSIGWYIIPGSAEARLSGFGGIKLFTGNQPRLKISYNGNIAIGDITPQAKLHVDGSVIASSILVQAQTADFVFDSNYLLMNLSELKTFIEKHKHLPDIPSAEEMDESGVDLATMNKLLLQKVEELTLYLLDQQDQITKLSDEVRNLKKSKNE